MQDSREPMWEFYRPAPLLAVIVFALNNYLFKAMFPGWLTGKLSDFALCFFLPLFVSGLLGWVTRLEFRARLLGAATLTASLFAAVKCYIVASDILNAATSTVTLRLGLGPSVNHLDPSDLVALPFVFVAVAYGLSRQGSTSHVLQTDC